MGMPEIDHPKVRKLNWCPVCLQSKDIGLVCCWTCYRQFGVKYGNPKVESCIDSVELSEKLKLAKENFVELNHINSVPQGKL